MQERDAPPEQLKEVLAQAVPTMRTAAEEGSALARKVLGFARGTNKKTYAHHRFRRAQPRGGSRGATQPRSRDRHRNKRGKRAHRGRSHRAFAGFDQLDAQRPRRDADGGTITIESTTESLDVEQAEGLRLTIGDELAVIKVRDTRRRYGRADPPPQSSSRFLPPKKRARAPGLVFRW
jgi:hypothetical protein